MGKNAVVGKPADQAQRAWALGPGRSILVQAPAGSGKTDLLTRRFLRLLTEVDDPGQIVAITFTTAAAAEMRHRILAELEKAAGLREESWEPEDADEFSMASLGRRALERSNGRGWELLDLPAQLRISTIDSFCRDLAMQQPLLSGLGGGLAIAAQPESLYRRAARRTLEEVGSLRNPDLSDAVEALLAWRDNNWQELEELLVEMLSTRDRWMHDFVFSPEPDFEQLRARLEQPFADAVREGLTEVSRLLDSVSGAREEALLLARFACSQPGGETHRALAEVAEFPNAPFMTPERLEEARQALLCLAGLVLTEDCGFRKLVNKNLGFPSGRKAEKARIMDLIRQFDEAPGLEAGLAAVRGLPPPRYTEEDWHIVRACFTLLRNAAAQLKVVFAEAAAVDFIEVAQIAGSVLQSDEGLPTEAAFAVADGIRHLLVDEFQDTSRRQHRLLAGLIAAWPERGGRTCFAVGDPMQSIYFFRDADAELFTRVKEFGLEAAGAEPLALDFVPLTANFRSAPLLVNRLNGIFGQVFAGDDGSGVTFSQSEPFPAERNGSDRFFKLHLNFCPQARKKPGISSSSDSEANPSLEAQTAEIIALIRSHLGAVEAARAAGEKYRVAVLARARNSLVGIAAALREAAIPFRAIDLEKLAARPEVLDALALGRALLNAHDRVAWLGVLRAPWCGLSLSDLHTLTSADDPELLARPIPELLAERGSRLSPAGRAAIARVLGALAAVPAMRAGQFWETGGQDDSAAAARAWGGEASASPGTWLQQFLLSLGGADCYDAGEWANLELLWTCVDGLPGGQADLLGPALNAALEKLTALPDPAASSDCGVQLMTIHKSKGLEFEVVIVPDLQAKGARGNRKLLSWMERGLKPEANSELAEAGASGEITEFLVAPLPSKGKDSGKSKAWVDRIYLEREAQEMRRILYVAATRAREELHFFARPAYKVEANGELSLATPSVGLLSTAWPAFEDEIRARFEEWKSALATAAAKRAATAAMEEAQVDYLAAAGGSDLFNMPESVARPVNPTMLRRLPDDYRRARGSGFAQDGGGRAKTASVGGAAATALYSRHEGGLVSRAMGTSVHALLEELARLRTTAYWPAARAGLENSEPRIAAQVRGLGIAPQQAARIAADAMQIALAASHEAFGEWILSPHADAESEVRWSGAIAGALRTVQADRIFRAGTAPCSEGEQSWWIIDYKTNFHAAEMDPGAQLPRLREQFAPQLEAYAQVLRNLHGADATVHAGLYYPRMLLFDWWEL